MFNVSCLTFNVSRSVFLVSCFLFECYTITQLKVSMLQQFNSSTLQQFNNSTLQQFNVSTLQQFNAILARTNLKR